MNLSSTDFFSSNIIIVNKNISFWSLLVAIWFGGNGRTPCEADWSWLSVLGRLGWEGTVTLSLSFLWNEDKSPWLGIGGGGGNELPAWELLHPVLQKPVFGNKQPPLSLWRRLGGSGGAIGEMFNLLVGFELVCTIGVITVEEAVGADRTFTVLPTATSISNVDTGAGFVVLTTAACIGVDLKDGLFRVDGFRFRPVACNIFVYWMQNLTFFVSSLNALNIAGRHILHQILMLNIFLSILYPYIIRIVKDTIFYIIAARVNEISNQLFGTTLNIRKIEFLIVGLNLFIDMCSEHKLL